MERNLCKYLKTKGVSPSSATAAISVARESSQNIPLLSTDSTGVYLLDSRRCFPSSACHWHRGCDNSLGGSLSGDGGGAERTVNAGRHGEERRQISLVRNWEGRRA